MKRGLAGLAVRLDLKAMCKHRHHEVLPFVSVAVVFLDGIVLLNHNPNHKLSSMVIPQALPTAKLRLERPLHSERIRNYIS